MDQVKARRPWYRRGATLFVTGAAAVALLPIGAAATSDNAGGLPDLVQKVEALTGQVNTNTTSVQSLQNSVSTLQSTVSAQQTQLDLQASQIAALQNALAAETAARKQGDVNTLASANAHSDAGDAAALASAKSYTDSALLNLNTSGSDNDSALQAAIAAETNRAQTAENGLQIGIINAVSAARADDATTYSSAVQNAVGSVEANLVNLAFQSNGSGNTFVTLLAGSPF